MGELYKVAVVGATGAVGREMVSILEERSFPVSQLSLFASQRTGGERISYAGADVTVEILDETSFDRGIDIALFSAGGEISQKYAPIAASKGTTVIDNSSVFRMDDNVPLVVPEVNPEALKDHKKIIANPNCSTIQMVVALKPIHDAASIKRVVVTTFQAVSGSGNKAINELLEQTKGLLTFADVVPEVYPHQIAFNVLPHIDTFQDDGYTKEEIKMVNETKKILDADIMITATAVRVPVFNSHSESINIETERSLSPDEARAILAEAPGITVFDVPSKNVYPMPIDTSTEDNVYIGRIRQDDTVENGLNMWVVADNLRKGAALNAVQIAEKLLEMNLL